MSEAGQPQPRKFKLRRLKPTEDIIQKNLEPLKENVKKKIRAQQAYYSKHNTTGVSPLIRDFKKRPVHQRLGRKLPYTLGTSTSAILPKMKLRKPGNLQFNSRTRFFSAQQRLNHIRAKQREVLSSSELTTPKRIKLRRNLPTLSLGGPTNLTVEVKNNRAFNGFNTSVRRFKLRLDPQLQQEIRKIQMDYQGVQMIAPMRITPSATGKLLHTRFSELS